jgi:catechol 2,3-dioxygenase-like lactoylglutathione lyase family enzyme
LQPHIDVITLAVTDVDRSVRFYSDLGLKTEGIVGTEFPGTDTEPAGRTAMFTLRAGLILSLYPATELAKDAGVGVDAVRGHGFSIGHVVASRLEVDQVLDTARQAGAQLVGSVGERPWGIYSGYFTDPDGHLWEVVHFQRAERA